MKLRVNKQHYKAPEYSYYPLRYEKKRIILMDSLRTGMQHVTYQFDQPDNKQLPAFTVARNGKVYQHYNPAFYNDIMGERDTDRESVFIAIENAGWLRPILEDRFFINWAGDHVPTEHVGNRKWRGHNQWQVYSNHQFDSLAQLILRLSEKFSIPLHLSGSNTLMSESRQFRGICTRSNFNEHHTDVNPFFNFLQLSKRLEELTRHEEPMG